MVVTDPYLRGSQPVEVALASLREAGIDAMLFDRARAEPTDVSLQEAIGFAADGYGLDALVVGTLPQHTVTKLSPRPASAEDLRRMFRESMTLW